MDDSGRRYICSRASLDLVRLLTGSSSSILLLLEGMLGKQTGMHKVGSSELFNSHVRDMQGYVFYAMGFLFLGSA